MRLIPLLLLQFLFAELACSKEQVMEGGKSPDGTFEVRVAGQNTIDEPNGYELHIYNAKTDKRLFTLPEIGGYLQFPAPIERDHAYWHASSHFVAITDQGTRHSRELYIVALFEGKPTVLQQPDFYQNALGRVGAVEIDFASVVTPQKWDGDDLILQVYFTANHRHSYTCEVVLHLDYAPHSEPRLSLKSVKKIKEGEG